ncbi:ribonuclease H2 subunit B [Chironomus tepperi]|uniref:ribonuclease H2 subunit B n=1 Tax=Chironomus tepperi TaxID=113505 RepID=UPI00391F7985
MARNNKNKEITKNTQNSLTKVFLLDKNLIKEENEIFKIELPRKTSMFLRSSNDIYELLQFNEKNRCFFVDNTVCSNGKIYLTTRIDPLFIFIQYIEAHCKSRAQPLDQILEKDAIIFLDVLKMDQMRLVADQKGPDDLKAFIFNEEKTIKWLKIKFKRIQESLKRQNIIKAGSASMNFVQSTLDCDKTENEDEVESTALGIISEYISLDLYEKLGNIFGISEKSKEPITQKRKSDVNHNEQDSKKIKSEPEEVLKENKVQPVKPVKNAAKFEKAAKGTKSISSFFAKK